MGTRFARGSGNARLAANAVKSLKRDEKFLRKDLSPSPYAPPEMREPMSSVMASLRQNATKAELFSRTKAIGPDGFSMRGFSAHEELDTITFSQPMTQSTSHVAQKDHRAGRSFKEQLVELMDPRPRNDLGMFEDAGDMGPSPDAIDATYKAPFRTPQQESALQKVMRSRKKKDEEEPKPE